MNTRKAFSAFFGLLLAVAFFTACEEPETLSELSFSSTIHFQRSQGLSPE